MEADREPAATLVSRMYDDRAVAVLIDEIWLELKADNAARHVVGAHGESPDRIFALTSSDLFELKPKESNVAAEVFVAVLFFTQDAINDILVDIWRDFIRPRLRQRFDVDVTDEADRQEG